MKLLDMTLGEGNISAIGISPVTKIPDLQENIDAFLAELKADGTIEDMMQRWVVQREESMPEIPVPEEPSIRIAVGTTGSAPPYTYYSDNQLTGFDIELTRRFAVWFNAEITFKIYDYDGIVAAAQGGDVDCIIANLFATPERRETLPFSEPVHIAEVAIMVRDVQAQGADGFLAPVMESFEKTFIKESRWRLFLQGISVTLLITVLSILLGSLLGFAAFMFCRKGNPAANLLTRICVRLVQQMLIRILDQTPLYVNIEYSAERERTIVTVSYSGPRYDPAEGENELSYTVLKNSVKELSYQYDSEAEAANRIKAVF